MDLELNSIPAGSICEGCLSVDRKLTPVFDEESRRFFRDILDPLDHVNHPLSLCWECSAVVLRTLRFRRQVKHAHNCLVSFMLHQSMHLPSLSNLNTSKQQAVQSYTYIENPQNDSANHSVSTKRNSSRRKVHSNENDETRVMGDESRPLFIKVEDQDDGDVQFDFGDDFDDRYEDVDDKDLKTILKSDTEEMEVGSRIRKKGKKIRTKVEFDDSDDEPLKMKKQKQAEDKPRGRRKKNSDGAKVDRRKHPAPKREKPAGVVHNARVARKLRQLNVASGQLEMVVLSWEEVEAERQAARHSAAFTRHQYRCEDCVLGFNHRFKLDNHMAKHDPAAGALQCGVCRVRCRHAHALCAHRRRHRVRWRCCACGATWSRAGVAADHHARAHGAPPATHTCAKCGQREPTLGKLRNHLKSHAERQKCELCGKTFRDRTSLRTHLFIHKGEKEYACARCGKRFLFKKAMEVHLVTHDAPAHLYCHTCDMNFKNKMSYYQHMKYNLKHIDPSMLKHTCTLCDKRFAKARRLAEHHTAVHLKATPVRCSLPGCSFACSSRAVLRTHVRMLHRGARALRNHVCHTCGKAYTTKKTLEGHMRSHTGERPFRCVRCPAAFGYEAALYNHNKLVHLKPKTGRGKQQPAPEVPQDPQVPQGAPVGWQLALGNTAQHISDIS